MTANEKWNRICDYFEKYRNYPEQKIQNIWESIFSELMGYSRLANEVERHRNIQIGSTERVITDIIIRNHEHDLFIIELKQGCLPVDNGMVKQLISYLKQLHNDLGILICNKIYIFDYDYHRNDEQQNMIKIDFVPDNPDGIKFIELFNKNDFNKDAIKIFIQQKIYKSENIEIIKKDLSGDLIYDLLSKHFLTRFNQDEYEEAINCFDITISPKSSILLGIQNNQVIRNTANNVLQTNSFSKSEAIILCKRNGLSLSGAITFSSENASSRKFWANPSKEYLLENWWLLLNDVSNKQVHVFYIPGNTIGERQIYIRSDKPDLIDLQIINQDGVFIDTRSKLNLNKWYLKSISIIN